MKRLILASNSPRRKMLLEQAGVRDFIVRPAPGEELKAGDLPPAEAVVEIARSKGRQVADISEPGDFILAADTMVYLEGELLGKPKDEAEAQAMLRRLSDKRHTVYTGVALLFAGREVTGVERTDVYFGPLTDVEIFDYVKTGEPMDKAGAYGLQGRAAVFIRRIEGDVHNVIGLPLYRLGQLMKEMGVQIF